MAAKRRRPYDVGEPELAEIVSRLIQATADRYEIEADSERAENLRQLVVTVLRLAQDGTSNGDLKLLNNAMKELRHAFRVFAPYGGLRKVACFGSARTNEADAEWQQAWAFAEQIVEAGWMVITGAGGGIMEAAQGGAGRESSFGVNIRLPFEQQANHVIAGDSKLINFRYFFTRKVVFVKEAHAIVLFPGGFGTHDEGFEALTLIQTGKSEIVPVVFLDAPGGSYWLDWQRYVESHLRDGGLISSDDLSLFTVTDDVGTAVRELRRFYSNYHSCRYVGDLLLLRVHHAPDAEQIEALNAEFGDILTGGCIEVVDPLPAERAEAVGCRRVSLQFERRRVGRLRQLIDRLNEGAPDAEASPGDASPHEIYETDAPGLEDEEA
jgi:uncharacterized protein (TIGR00730 family)